MSELTHFNTAGEAHMVDVGGKPQSHRVAVATGCIRMKAETLDLIRRAEHAKGDVLGIARTAGIMAAKRTAELIPLCHPLPLTRVNIDFREDVPPLPDEQVERIAAILRQGGANAKISSIHVNAWFGDYDKIAMTKILMDEVFGIDLTAEEERYTFAGDSPNDAPMFGFFTHSVGVANVLDFRDRLNAGPAYITKAAGGEGFQELTDYLLSARQG